MWGLWPHAPRVPPARRGFDDPKLARHSSIIHKLQDGWDFGDVYLQARHQHSSMTAKYAEFTGVEAPDWAEETPF